MNNIQEFAALIKAERKKNGKRLSQQALADAAGINVATLKRVEKAEFDPKFSTVLALCRALGLPIRIG